ncbi:hypothetical protein FQN50_008759 [Emmonsiellopsis sp. PD_5]|nr:hypothetical protein FQN50_008759 [Emmonsiellopsis sp. PD_5]
MGDPFTPKEEYGQVLYEFLRNVPKVIRLDENRVLKSSITDSRETEAMKFIAANTTIPVPKVYDAKWSDDPAWKPSQIVMEYIPGESLDKAWEKLSHEQRLSTCAELRGFLEQLQQLKGTRIQAVNGGRVTVGLRFPRQGGPFDTEKEFHDFLVESSSQRLSPFFKQYARDALADDHEIRFAHGDFSPRNIIVDECGHVKAVLDWDRAGWYPEYWDHNRMLSENPGVRNYFPYINHILPFKYTQEVLAIGYLLRISGDG